MAKIFEKSLNGWRASSLDAYEDVASRACQVLDDTEVIQFFGRYPKACGAKQEISVEEASTETDLFDLWCYDIFERGY